MLTHQTIRTSLERSFNQRYGAGQGVTLVARYVNPALQLQGMRSQIFFPDFHLLNDQDSLAYPNWGFDQDEDLLLALKVVARLKDGNPGQLQVWHLGDLFDIWRARSGLPPNEEVDRISHDHREIIDRLLEGPDFGVRAKLTAGNHDYAMWQLSDYQDRTARFRIFPNQSTAQGQVVVLHGHMFSWLERVVPHKLKAAAVRIAKWHSSGQKDLDQKKKKYSDARAMRQTNEDLPPGDEPLGTSRAELAHKVTLSLPDCYNVVPGDSGQTQAGNRRFYKPAKKLAEALRDRGHRVRLIVHAHTHFARIVAGTQDTGVPFVLLDCGAWIGKCKLPRPPDAPQGGPDNRPTLHCGQLGVVVENDVRIYHLGRREV